MANNSHLVPNANLDNLKFEVAEELSNFPSSIRDEQAFQSAVDRFKFEIAQELGVPLKKGYNGDLPTRQLGAIGGRIGGKIGGHMVRRMIELAEQQLAQGTRPLK